MNISKFMHFSFYQSYYSKFSRKKDFTIDLLISLLHIYSEMRNCCGFLTVPDKSQFSRFKTAFFHNLNDLFHNLVDYSEDFCQQTNPLLSSILITNATLCY